MPDPPPLHHVMMQTAARSRASSPERVGSMSSDESRTIAPYGSWRSPITAVLIAEGGVTPMWPQSIGESLYWNEARPLEDGRCVVVRRGPDGGIAAVTPAGVGARTLVHEYGGGMYAAFRNAGGGDTTTIRAWRQPKI